MILIADDLKIGTGTGIDPDRGLMPPARFDDLQVQQGFEHVQRRKIAAGNFAFRHTRLPAGASLESGPELTRAVERGFWRENEDAFRTIFRESREVGGRRRAVK